LKLTPKSIALTFAGGAIGSLTRWAISDASEMATMLWFANILGTLLLGYFSGSPRFESQSRREFWAVGFCGGFTTMSGLAAWQFYGTFSWVSILIMFALGLVAYFVGLKIGSRMGTK
jgi:fluoride ion exporter CrcB/FEX